MLTFQQPFLSLLLVFISAIVAMFGLQRWQLRHIRVTARAVTLMLLCCSLWILANALELASADLQTGAVWNKLQLLAMAPVPTLWFIMAMQVVGYKPLSTVPRALLIGIPLVLTVLLIITNDYHHLIITRIWLDISGDVAYVRFGSGPVLQILYLYAYGQISLSLYFIVKQLTHTQGVFRWQGIILVFGAVFSIFANYHDVIGSGPLPQIQFTPLGISLAVPLFVFTLRRMRRADLLPVIREKLIHVLHDSVVVLDAENRIVDLNPKAEEMLGIGLKNAAGKLIDVIWPQWSPNQDILLQKVQSRQEIQLFVGDQLHTLEASSSRLDDWRGIFVGRVLVFRDVTEQVRAEDALRLNEEYFRALTENSTDMIVIISSDGIIKYISPSFQRMFSLAKSEIIGKQAHEFVHPDEVAILVGKFSEFIHKPGISITTSVRVSYYSENWRVLECTASNLLAHPAVKGIVINARDVTERTAAEDALRKSEERYRLHFAHVGDVIFSYDTEFRFLTMSPSIERHLGYKPEELVGKSFLEVPLLSPEFLTQAAAAGMRVLNGEMIEDYRYELIAKDGTHRTAAVTGSPIYQDSKVTSGISVARDITERVQAENRLRASLQEKEVLLKEIHHRVKNNLQIISSLLNLQAVHLQDPSLQAQYQDSQDRIRSMALIHERLYRSDDLAQIDFGSYLRDLTGSLAQTYQSQRQGITLNVSTDTVFLDIDTAMPCGLLVNELVSNALKHAFPSGRNGTVSVELHNHAASSNQLRLVVRDDGIGFPADLEYPKTTTLGLQLVSSLVRQLGGTVVLDRQPGTAFDISFVAIGAARKELPL